MLDAATLEQPTDLLNVGERRRWNEGTPKLAHPYWDIQAPKDTKSGPPWKGIKKVCHGGTKVRTAHGVQGYFLKGAETMIRVNYWYPQGGWGYGP